MNAKERINAILSHEGITAAQLGEQIGDRRPQAIYDILSEKTKSISKTMAAKIQSAKPYYRLEWLISGEGPMLDDDAPAPVVNDKNLIPQLLDRIDKLIAIHEQDARNLDRLLTLMTESGAFERTPKKRTSSM